MSSHSLLKKLQVLRDKYELRRDDIAVGEAALADESRELSGRQEQLGLVNEKISSAVKEMDELGVQGRTDKAAQEEFLHEEESLRHTFTTILDHGLKELREERKRALAEAEAAEAAETELREVSVLFGDEEAVFRVSDDSYTFDELTTDACRFFELHPLDVLIVDDQDERWAGDASVRQKMAAFDNAYGRVFLKMREDEGNDEEMEDPDNLLQLLLNEEEELEEEEDEEEEPPEMQAVQVVMRGANQDKGKKKKKKLNRGQLYRELPIFILFTMLFIVSLTFRRQTVAGYYQVNAIRTILVEEAFGDFNEKTYSDIANFEEIWDWIEGVLVGGLYPEGKYNDEEFNRREVGSVMTYNRLVGAIRLRTVRSVPNVECPGTTASLNKRLVMNSSGDIYDQLFVDECHGAASPGNEAKYPYGPGIDLMDQFPNCEAIPAPPPPPSVFLDVYGVPPTEKQLQDMAIRKLCRAFTWSPATRDDEFPERFYTDEAGITGKLGFYPGGGYVRDTDNPIDCRQRPETDPFPNPEGVCERGEAAREDLLLAIDQLRSNRWLDEATRAMFIKVTFYNGNLGFFMVITFVLEFSQGGVVWPKTEMSVVNQEMYRTDTQFDLIITIIEFVTYGFTTYYTFVQLNSAYQSIRKTGSLADYLSDVFNILECIVLVAFYTSSYLRFSLLSSLKPATVIFEDYYTDFGNIGKLYLETFNFDSLCVIALFFKMLKYAQLNVATSMLWSVLLRSGKDIGYFTIMLVILLIAFSMMSVQFFGQSTEGYSGYYQSVISLLLVLLGQFDVQGMQQASPYGLPFFFLFIIVMFLIMMNIFLAILGEAYTVVRSENDELAANKVKTKSGRGFMSYLRLVRAVIKAKLKLRHARKYGSQGRSAELPPFERAGGGGAMIEPPEGGKGKSVTFKA